MVDYIIHDDLSWHTGSRNQAKYALRNETAIAYFHTVEEREEFIHRIQARDERIFGRQAQEMPIEEPFLPDEEEIPEIEMTPEALTDELEREELEEKAEEEDLIAEEEEAERIEPHFPEEIEEEEIPQEALDEETEAEEEEIPPESKFTCLYGEAHVKNAILYVYGNKDKHTLNELEELIENRFPNFSGRINWDERDFKSEAPEKVLDSAIVRKKNGSIYAYKLNKDYSDISKMDLSDWDLDWTEIDDDNDFFS